MKLIITLKSVRSADILKVNPKILKIELTNKCNANCVYCKRPEETDEMDIVLFKEIVNSFPEVTEVQPQFVGEPFIHSRIFEALRFLKLLNKKVVFFTNGSLLDNYTCEQLGVLKPDHIIISVDADNNIQYEKIRRGLNWGNLLQNIYRLKHFKSADTRLTAKITICKENKNDIGKIKDFWQNIVDDIAVSYEVSKTRKAKPVAKKKCVRPWEHIVVNYKGEFVLCCCDWEGEVILGMYKRDGHQAFYGEKADRIRNTILLGYRPDICKKCNYEIKKGLKK